MICCDSCEDWFHGTCVNITKAMGLDMEQKGIDWTCPKCLKKMEEQVNVIIHLKYTILRNIYFLQKQPKITDLLIRKSVPDAVHLSDKNVTQRIFSTETRNIGEISIITGNSEQNVIKTQPKEVTQTVIDTSTPKIQSGKFINIKDLAGKKVILQTSGSRKLFLTTQPLKTTTNLGSSIRTYTLVKPVSQHNIKVIKPLPTSQSPSQNMKVVQTTITPTSITATSIATTSIATTSNTTTSNVPDETLTSCIVCKKTARPNSIYCHDDCIRRHAQHAWSVLSKSHNEIVSTPLSKNPQDDKLKKKQKGLFEEELSMADRRTKLERVHMMM